MARPPYAHTLAEFRGWVGHVDHAIAQQLLQYRPLVSLFRLLTIGQWVKAVKAKIMKSCRATSNGSWLVLVSVMFCSLLCS